jgi:hypothetical protein
MESSEPPITKSAASELLNQVWVSWGAKKIQDVCDPWGFELQSALPRLGSRKLIKKVSIHMLCWIELKIDGHDIDLGMIMLAGHRLWNI